MHTHSYIYIYIYIYTYIHTYIPTYIHTHFSQYTYFRRSAESLDFALVHNYRSPISPLITMLSNSCSLKSYILKWRTNNFLFTQANYVKKKNTARETAVWNMNHRRYCFCFVRVSFVYKIFTFNHFFLTISHHLQIQI